MSKRPATVKILLALPWMLILVWSVMAAAQTNPFVPPLKAGKLMGMKVEDSDGENAGTVRNLVIDARSGKLRYVVIGSGGFLGVRSTLRLAPPQVLSGATAKRDTLAINMNDTRWKHAPVFKSSSLASLADPNRAREISRYFEQSSANTAHAAVYSLSTTGYDAGQSADAPASQLKFASDLIGRRVVNRKQEKVGEVGDLLVSFGQPRPAFAIISTGRLFRREYQYAVPLNALESTDGDGKLLLNADNTTLQQAPLFNQRVWESRDTNMMDRVYRCSKTED